MTMAARGYTKDVSHPHYPHPRAGIAVASRRPFLMRPPLDFRGRWLSHPLHRPGSVLPPIPTLHLIQRQSPGYPRQRADHSPLSLGRGCRDPRRRFSYRDRILFNPSRPGDPSMASLSGIGTGVFGHWIPLVGLFHLNHVPAWSDACQDLVRGHGHERSGPRGSKSLQRSPHGAVMHPSRPASPWCVRIGRIQQTFRPLFQGGVPVAVPDSLPPVQQKGQGLFLTVGTPPGLFPAVRSGARGSVPSRYVLPTSPGEWDGTINPASSRSPCGSAAIFRSTGLAVPAPRAAETILQSLCDVARAGEALIRGSGNVDFNRLVIPDATGTSSLPGPFPGGPSSRRDHWTWVPRGASRLMLWPPW